MDKHIDIYIYHLGSTMNINKISVINVQDASQRIKTEEDSETNVNASHLDFLTLFISNSSLRVSST